MDSGTELSKLDSRFLQDLMDVWEYSFDTNRWAKRGLRSAFPRGGVWSSEMHYINVINVGRQTDLLRGIGLPELAIR